MEFEEEEISKDDELRELKDENNRLLSLVAEKELELKNLIKKHENDLLMSSVKHINNDAAAAKIVELSKKIRELNSELQSSQTKSNNFQKKCSEYESKLNDSLSNAPNLKSEIDKTSSESQKDELKLLQDRIRQGDFKLTEARSQVSSLKAEIKMLNKVLVSEVGEGVSVAALLSGDKAAWKGRSEQINMLQKKVSVLKKQLEKSKDKGDFVDGGGGGGDDNVYEAANYKSELRGRTPAAMENLKNIDKSKMEQIQKLTDDLAVLGAEHAVLKGKQEGLKARNQVLVNEGRSLKGQVKMLLQKAKHDEELVEALLKQQQQLRRALVEGGQEQLNLNNKNNNSNVELHNLQQEIALKDAKLNQLETQLQQLMTSHHIEKNTDFRDSLEGLPCNTNSNNQATLSAQEGHVLRTLNVTLQIERDKWKEAVEGLTQSNDKLTREVEEKKSELKNLLKKCGRLEGEVKRLYAGSASQDRKQRTDASGKVDVEALKLKLETMEDEKQGLKRALDAAFKARKEQIGWCEKMLKQARSAYTNSVEKLKKGGGEDYRDDGRNDGDENSTDAGKGGESNRQPSMKLPHPPMAAEGKSDDKKVTFSSRTEIRT